MLLIFSSFMTIRDRPGEVPFSDDADYLVACDQNQGAYPPGLHQDRRLGDGLSRVRGDDAAGHQCLDGDGWLEYSAAHVHLNHL